MNRKDNSSVACAIVIRDRRVLIQERNRMGGRKAEFPMGRVEDGESYDSAALRELLEETGLAGSLSGDQTIVLGTDSGIKVGFVFISVQESALPQSDSRRMQKYSWCRISEIPLHDFHSADQVFINQYLGRFIDP